MGKTYKRFDIEEFERNAEDVSYVKREIIKRLEAEEYPFPIGHEAQLRRDRDWNILRHQVVGAEVFYD